MKVPLCPLSHINIQHSNWELVDLLNIEEHIATETNCQHPQLNTWVLSEPVKAFGRLVLKGSQEGSTPLLMACDRGNFESVKHIVENWGVNINATASFHFFYKGVLPMKVLGASPLFVAAYRGHYNIVRYLVGRGADVSVSTSMDSSYHMGGLIPLQGSVAAAEPTIEQAEIVRFLLNNGSDPNVLARYRTPMWRMRSCSPKAAITLLEFGMNVTPNMLILHHWASKFKDDDGSLELVQLLLKKGVDPQTKDGNGRTAIFYSAAYGYKNRLNFTYLDFLLGKEEVDRKDKIEALELAGAIILYSTMDAEQVSRAFGYWRRALELRYQMGATPIPKTPMPFKYVFKKVPLVEFLDLNDLQEVLNNRSQHKLQALLVQLRIVSVIDAKPDSCRKYLHRRLFDLLRPEEGPHQTFREAVGSLFIVLEFILRCDPKEYALWYYTRRIDKKLVVMLKNNPDQLTPDILKTAMELIIATDPTHFPEAKLAHADPLSLHMKTLLQFVSILADHPEMLNKDIMDSLTQLVKEYGRTKDGVSLLLLACSKVSTRTDLSPTISLLLKAKADPNVLGGPDGRSTLHAIASCDPYQAGASRFHCPSTTGCHCPSTTGCHCPSTTGCRSSPGYGR